MTPDDASTVGRVHLAVPAVVPVREGTAIQSRADVFPDETDYVGLESFVRHRGRCPELPICQKRPIGK